ncbi:hypothetical protein SteCoe_24756 [Stentor coeruleus]|uniref:Uncharacterized protein n=1 Tax=Stentor coeruleus TaxID=5963 RepID=A0A1R2BGY9_9CILI|nr:hypothetical protein SteCoe_24756 [Stentor coeruleus]
MLNYQEKLANLQEEKSRLTEALEAANYKFFTPLKKVPCDKYIEKSISPVKSEDLNLQGRVTDTIQKINREKKRLDQDCEKIEDYLRQSNTGLFVIVSKFNLAKKNNLELKYQLRKLIKERQILTSSYSKLTGALVRETRLSEKVEKIESQERKNRDKLVSINVLKKMIEHLKIPEPVENPQLNAIINKINKLEEMLKENEKIKRNLKISIEMTQAEVDYKKRNPQNIPPALANKYYREEIKMIELDMAEKSRIIKNLEKQKLCENINYSDSLKEKELLEPKKKNTKSVSCICSYSNLKPEKNGLRNYLGQDKVKKNRNDSSNITGMLRKNGEPTITREVLSALDVYAPGKSITSKIIEFNRGHTRKLSSKS